MVLVDVVEENTKETMRERKDKSILYSVIQSKSLSRQNSNQETKLNTLTFLL